MSLSISLSALQSSLSSWQDAAERVAAGPLNDGFARNVVDMQLAQRDVEASVKIIKAQQEMLGYLIDELA